jgi:hypothetical protein
MQGSEGTQTAPREHAAGSEVVAIIEAPPAEDTVENSVPGDGTLMAQAPARAVERPRVHHRGHLCSLCGPLRALSVPVSSR